MVLASMGVLENYSLLNARLCNREREMATKQRVIRVKIILESDVGK